MLPGFDIAKDEGFCRYPVIGQNGDQKRHMTNTNKQIQSTGAMTIRLRVVAVVSGGVRRRVSVQLEAVKSRGVQHAHVPLRLLARGLALLPLLGILLEAPAREAA